MVFRVCVLVLLAVPALAQQNGKLEETITSVVGTGKHADQDSNYVANYSELFALRTQGIIRAQAFRFQAEGLERFLDYAPNVAASIGLAFNYKWLGVGVGIKLPRSADQERGETEQVDIQINSYGYKVGFDAFYQSYDGFYLANTRRLLGQLPSGDRFYLRPDIRTEAYGANVYYVFNYKRFSYRSVFVFNERQLKTAGSWLVQVNATRFTATADSAFVPTDVQLDVTNPDVSALTRLRFFQAGALGGYGFNLVVKRRWYASATVLLGLAVIDYRGDVPEGKLGGGIRLGGRALVRGGAGYNGERWFFGGNLVTDVYNFRYNQELTSNFIVGQVRLFVGHRFNWRPW